MRSVVDFGGELLNESVNLRVRADNASLAENFFDAVAGLYTFFRGEKKGSSCAGNCSAYKSGDCDHAIVHGGGVGLGVKKMVWVDTGLCRQTISIGLTA